MSNSRLPVARVASPLTDVVTRANTFESPQPTQLVQTALEPYKHCVYCLTAGLVVTGGVVLIWLTVVTVQEQ